MYMNVIGAKRAALLMRQNAAINGTEPMRLGAEPEDALFSGVAVQVCEGLQDGLIFGCR